MSTEIEISGSSGTTEFLVSLVINTVIGCLILVGFSVFRRRLPYYFDARRVDAVRNPGYKPKQIYLERPPKQSSTFFGWIRQTIDLPESTILRTAGVDAVITLRFGLRIGIYLTIYALAALLIILPIQAKAAQDNLTRGFNALSIMSLRANDSKMGAHLVMVYVFTGLLLYILRRTWIDNISLKAKWLSNDQIMGRKLTIMLTQIPARLQDEAALYTLLDSIYPGKIYGVTIVRDTAALNKLYLEREQLVGELNHARGLLELQAWKPTGEQKRPIYKDSMCCGNQYDLIHHHTDEIARIDNEIRQEYEKRDTAPHLPTAFVTVTNAITAATLTSVPLAESRDELVSQWAPEPSDLLWFGIQQYWWYKWIMNKAMFILHVLIVIFWMIPVGFISSLLTIEALSQRLPFLEPVLTVHPIIQGFLSGFLPSLAMVIFMALLPKILAGMGHLQGLESASYIAQYVTRKYFVFQFFNFFLVACFSSSFFTELDSMIENPGRIPGLLARGLPQSALLFVNYIMLRAFTTNFMGMIDFVDIALNYVGFKFSTTPQECINSWKPHPFLYGKLYPEMLLILIICFTFGTIQPLILPFGALYFFTLFFANKFDLTWLSVTPYESAGGFWPLLFDRIMLGMVVAQLTITGIFGLKESIVCAILMIPILIITIASWVNMSSWYRATEHRLTLVSANHTDRVIASLYKSHTDKSKQQQQHADNTATSSSYLGPEKTTIQDDQDKDMEPITDTDLKALTQGHLLPLPQDKDILPFLMTDRYADTVYRDKFLSKKIKNDNIDLSNEFTLSEHYNNDQDPLLSLEYKAYMELEDILSSTNTYTGTFLSIIPFASRFYAMYDDKKTQEYETAIHNDGNTTTTTPHTSPTLSDNTPTATATQQQQTDDVLVPVSLPSEDVTAVSSSTSVPTTPKVGGSAGQHKKHHHRKNKALNQQDIERQLLHKLNKKVDVYTSTSLSMEKRTIIAKNTLRWSQTLAKRNTERQERAQAKIDAASARPSLAASAAVSSSGINTTNDIELADVTSVTSSAQRTLAVIDKEDHLPDYPSEPFLFKPLSASARPTGIPAEPKTTVGDVAATPNPDDLTALSFHERNSILMMRYSQPSLNQEAYQPVMYHVWDSRYLDYYWSKKRGNKDEKAVLKAEKCVEHQHDIEQGTATALPGTTIPVNYDDEQQQQQQGNDNDHDEHKDEEKDNDNQVE